MHNAQRKRKRTYYRQERHQAGAINQLQGHNRSHSDSPVTTPINLSIPSIARGINQGNLSQSSVQALNMPNAEGHPERGLFDEINVDDLLTQFEVDDLIALPSVGMWNNSQQQFAHSIAPFAPMSAPWSSAGNPTTVVPTSGTILPPVVELPDFGLNTVESLHRPMYSGVSQVSLTGTTMFHDHQSMSCRQTQQAVMSNRSSMPHTASSTNLYIASYDLFNMPPESLPRDVQDALKASLEVQVRVSALNATIVQLNSALLAVAC